MHKTSRRRAVLLLLIPASVLFSCTLLVARSYDGIRASQKLCASLLEAGYMENREDCVISDHPPSFIPRNFPIGIVDEEYVRIAMQDFELTEYQPLGCQMTREKSCTRLVYRIRHAPGNPFIYEYYSFRFLDGKLRSLAWHN
jgi:hypothetical protein